MTKHFIYTPRNTKYDLHVPLLIEKGKTIYLRGFSWDCDWYWGGGFLEGSYIFTHFNQVFGNANNKNCLQNEWKGAKVLIPEKIMWILFDLFNHFYVCKEMSEICKRNRYTSDTDNFIHNNKLNNLKSSEIYINMNARIEFVIIPAIMLLMKDIDKVIEQKQRTENKIEKLEKKLEDLRNYSEKEQKELFSEIFSLKKEI